MKFSILILMLAALLTAGCKSKSSKPSPTTEPSATPSPSTTPPVPSPNPTPAPTPTPTPSSGCAEQVPAPAGSHWIEVGKDSAGCPVYHLQNDVPTPPPTPTPAPSASGQDHVVLVIEENHKLSDILTQMPWLVQMGNTYGHSSNFHSTASGSLRNYLVLSSGDYDSCSGSSCPKPLTSDNIFQELDKAGKSWKVYCESLPSAGFLGGSSGNYVKRHNPAPWYASVLNSKADLAKIVPFTEFAKDLSSNHLPNYSLIIPNLANDAHNGSMAVADAWLKKNIAPLLDSPDFQPGQKAVAFITFDECGGGTNFGCGAAIYTAAIGPSVLPKSSSAKLYSHYDLLRTMLEFLSIKNYFSNTSKATFMSDIVKK